MPSNVVAQIITWHRVDKLREALRPVLLVHVLGAHVSASSSTSAATATTATATPPAPVPPPPAVYDAAGERLLTPPSPDGDGGSGDAPDASSGSIRTPLAPPAASPTTPAALLSQLAGGAAAGAPGGVSPLEPGIPFGRPSIPAGGAWGQGPQQAVGAPPLKPGALVDLAVGAATLGVLTPDVAEAVAAWVLSPAHGGLQVSRRHAAFSFSPRFEVALGRVLGGQRGAERDESLCCVVRACRVRAGAERPAAVQPAVGLCQVQARPPRAV